MDDIKESINALKQAFNVQKDTELCDQLNISYSAIDAWKRRGKLPDKYEKYIQQPGRVNRIDKKNDKSMSHSVINEETVIKIPKLSSKVSAGYNIQQIDSVEKIGELILDIAIFKTPPPKKIFAMQVDGYSMIPMIFPDSWVIFDDCKQFKGDGLYIINWDDCLMVKQISATPKKGVIQIISSNKDYQSWEVDLNDTQCSFMIFGKVIRTIL